MNDRLAELRGGAPMGGGGDIESAVPVGSSAFMAPFFDDVQDIKKAMSTIRYNIGQIEKDHGENLTAISAEQGRACNQRLDDLMKTTNGVATQVRNKLKSMDAENKDFAQRNVGSSEARIRSNMHGTLTRKFVDLMAEYQELQTKYKNKYREKVERQYRIVNPRATRDEIDEMFDSGNQQQEIFTQQILQGSHAAAKNALADIQERHNDIMKLETSIAELHQLFVDMSVLVESQGELLDQVEYQVSQSVNYTGKAVSELRQANTYQKKVRRKMCCVICIILVIIAVIAVPLLQNMNSDSDSSSSSRRLLLALEWFPESAPSVAAPTIAEIAPPKLALA